MQALIFWLDRWQRQCCSSNFSLRKTQIGRQVSSLKKNNLQKLALEPAGPKLRYKPDSKLSGEGCYPPTHPTLQRLLRLLTCQPQLKAPGGEPLLQFTSFSSAPVLQLSSAWGFSYCVSLQHLANASACQRSLVCQNGLLCENEMLVACKHNPHPTCKP